MKTINVFAPTRPHSKQLEVLEDGSRFKLIRAGRKWRKTSLGVAWLNEMALKCTHKLTYPFILPYQTQARESVWRDHVTRLLDELTNKGVPHKKNEVDLSITYPNGARFKLLGSENDIALRSVSNWGAVVLDEYDDWKTGVWESVIRPNLIPNKAPAMVMGTPKGKRNIFKLSESPEFKEFHYTSYDNPDLDPDELNALINEYKSKGEDYFKQEILAEYVKPVGLVYREWDESRQFLSIDYDPNLPLHITFDWGINDPTSVIWIQPNKSETRVIDYYEASNANIEHFTSVINSKPYKHADLFTGDPSGKARNLATGTSVIDILATKGIYVRTKDGVKIPDQIRVSHTVIPGLYVAKKAERFRDCLLNYKYPETNFALRNQDNEIPIHDEWSHGMRAFEYWCVNTVIFRPALPITPGFGTGQEVLNELFDKSSYNSEEVYY